MRFQEVIGVRPEAGKANANIFGRVQKDTEQVLDWSAERPKSKLACVLLELIRLCFKDVRPPDFKEETYTQVEVVLCILFENLSMPSLVQYQQEVLQICNQMITVKR